MRWLRRFRLFADHAGTHQRRGRHETPAQPPPADRVGRPHPQGRQDAGSARPSNKPARGWYLSPEAMRATRPMRPQIIAVPEQRAAARRRLDQLAAL